MSEEEQIRPGHLAPGEVVGERYVVGKLLGAGGFARVYRGWDPEIQRDVAIKVLNINMGLSPKDHEKAIKRFRQEAQTAARIKHPSVVSIFDIGVTDEFEQPYIVMDFLEGKSLEDWLDQQGALEPARALPLFVDALEALGEGHELGIVHKDLKPANLFLCDPGTRRERLKVVDFGIARVDGGDERFTTTGQIAGTPQYLAPEYIATQLVSPALDVYQMGLILVETLSGRRVVDDDNMLACVMLHSSGELPLPDGLMSGPLGPVLHKALRTDPELRYADAGQMAEALAAVDPGQVAAEEAGSSPRERRQAEIVGTADTVAAIKTPPAVAPPEPQPTAVSPKRSVWPLLAALVVLVVLVAGGGAAVIGLMDDEGPTSDADATTTGPTGDTTQLEDKAEIEPADVEEEPDDSVAAQPDEAAEVGVADDEPTEPIVVDVSAHPPHAVISADGKRIGRGKATLEFSSADAEPIDVIVRAQGYRNERRTVTPTAGKVVIRLREEAVVMP